MSEQLYCVATLSFRNKQWVGGFEYLHAQNQAEARNKFTVGNSGALISGKLKITGIAPVVGYFQDKSDTIYV
jgi:hypothetical protein